FLPRMSAPSSATVISPSAARRDAFIRAALQNIGVPVLAFALFLGFWSLASRNIQVSFGSLPGPSAVATEFGNLWKEHVAEGVKEREFNERQVERKAAYLAKNPQGEWKDRTYAPRPTFFRQIVTSLQTV